MTFPLISRRAFDRLLSWLRRTASNADSEPLPICPRCGEPSRMLLLFPTCDACSEVEAVEMGRAFGIPDFGKPMRKYRRITAENYFEAKKP